MFGGGAGTSSVDNSKELGGIEPGSYVANGGVSSRGMPSISAVRIGPNGCGGSKQVVVNCRYVPELWKRRSTFISHTHSIYIRHSHFTVLLVFPMLKPYRIFFGLLAFSYPC